MHDLQERYRIIVCTCDSRYEHFMIEQIKAALYVRLSQEDRNKLHPEDNSESINNQIMLLKSRCENE